MWMRKRNSFSLSGEKFMLKESSGKCVLQCESSRAVVAQVNMLICASHSCGGVRNQIRRGCDIVSLVKAVSFIYHLGRHKGYMLITQHETRIGMLGIVRYLRMKEIYYYSCRSSCSCFLNSQCMYLWTDVKKLRLNNTHQQCMYTVPKLTTTYDVMDDILHLQKFRFPSQNV